MGNTPISGQTDHNRQIIRRNSDPGHIRVDFEAASNGDATEDTSQNLGVQLRTLESYTQEPLITIDLSQRPAPPAAITLSSPRQKKEKRFDHEINLFQYNLQPQEVKNYKKTLKQLLHLAFSQREYKKIGLKIWISKETGNLLISYSKKAPAELKNTFYTISSKLEQMVRVCAEKCDTGESLTLCLEYIFKALTDTNKSIKNSLSGEHIQHLYQSTLKNGHSEIFPIVFEAFVRATPEPRDQFCLCIAIPNPAAIIDSLHACFNPPHMNLISIFNPENIEPTKAVFGTFLDNIFMGGNIHENFLKLHPDERHLFITLAIYLESISGNWPHTENINALIKACPWEIKPPFYSPLKETIKGLQNWFENAHEEKLGTNGVLLDHFSKTEHYYLTLANHTWIADIPCSPETVTKREEAYKKFLATETESSPKRIAQHLLEHGLFCAFTSHEFSPFEQAISYMVGHKLYEPLRNFCEDLLSSVFTALDQTKYAEIVALFSRCVRKDETCYRCLKPMGLDDLEEKFPPKEL